MASSIVGKAARQALTSARLSSTPPTTLVPRRSFAGPADHDGPPKINFWKDPLSPSKWKEEHIVILSLTGWGLLFYSAGKGIAKLKRNMDEKKTQTSS